MILDLLENLEKYKYIIPQYDKIAAFLQENNLNEMPEGKHKISDDYAFILLQNYSTKPESEIEWESHKKYIDIQIVLDGEEYIVYTPALYLTIKNPYDQEEDIIIYHNNNDPGSKVFLKQGLFSIFYPEDAHAPGILAGDVKAVKKAVIKTALY